MLMTWLLIIMAFYVPYRVCLYWEDETKSVTVFRFELFFDVAFGIDIIFNFVTAYYDPTTRKLVTAPKLIVLNYLKGFFIIDLIAIFPFSFLLSNPSPGIANKVGKLGRLPKMVRF